MTQAEDRTDLNTITPNTTGTDTTDLDPTTKFHTDFNATSLHDSRMPGHCEPGSGPAESMQPPPTHAPTSGTMPNHSARTVHFDDSDNDHPRHSQTSHGQPPTSAPSAASDTYVTAQSEAGETMTSKQDSSWWNYFTRSNDVSAPGPKQVPVGTTQGVPTSQAISGVTAEERPSKSWFKWFPGRREVSGPVTIQPSTNKPIRCQYGLTSIADQRFVPTTMEQKMLFGQAPRSYTFDLLDVYPSCMTHRGNRPADRLRRTLHRSVGRQLGPLLRRGTLRRG
ncbi:hypothetical protein M231_06429 [Tremella mesenterica]|uniref:Uncharacterized protein n=1 Tax=Tremella mesenterica TaxID=5217 RepID=A0A4Q1BGC2_TREME|nr:hypothetical protein M231_06429 [Tremella mesenterica]